MRKSVLTGLTALFLMSGTALADTAVGGAKIHYRADLQQERIDQGIENGSLTYREALRLQKQQKYINSIIRLAERDGIVTIRESRIIEREQDKASRQIRNQKHDRQYY